MSIGMRKYCKRTFYRINHVKSIHVHNTTQVNNNRVDNTLCRIINAEVFY